MPTDNPLTSPVNTTPNSVELTCDLGKLRLKNPLMNASGILGSNSSLLLRLASTGIGAVVTKSVGLKPRVGYPNPTLIPVGEGFINAMGLPNPGAPHMAKEVKIAKRHGVVVIASVFGRTPQEYAEVALRMEQAGADAVELNLSCPHVDGVIRFSQSPELSKMVVKQVKDQVSIPVFAKLTAEASSVVEVGKSVEKAGADGIVAINTVSAMLIDVKLKRPVLANKIGGLSGPPIKPIAVRCVYQLYEAVNIPLIGVGGIVSARDAIEFILAGSSAVQIGSAIALKGLDVFKDVLAGLKAYMEEEGFKSVKEMVGLAHRAS